MHHNQFLILIFILHHYIGSIYGMNNTNEQIRTYHMISSADINIEVWVSVLRMSTTYLTNTHIHALPWFKKAVHRYGGWYEGLSSGVPGEYVYPPEKVPYGCWHTAWPSNIYINIGNFLSLTRNKTVSKYANDYFENILHINKQVK